MILQIGPLQHASKLPSDASSSEIRHFIREKEQHRRAFNVLRASTSKKEVEYSASIEVGLQTQQGVAQPEDFSISVTKSNYSSSSNISSTSNEEVGFSTASTRRLRITTSRKVLHLANGSFRRLKPTRAPTTHKKGQAIPLTLELFVDQERELLNHGKFIYFHRVIYDRLFWHWF